MRKVTIPAILASTLLLGPGGAAAQTVLLYAGNPERLAETLRNEGYQAKLGTDNDGDPTISSGADGTKFSIYFYGCDEGNACQSIQFKAGWRMTDGISLETINEWNVSSRFGKAYRDDENDPILEMNVNMDGGLPTKTFLDTVDWWSIGMREFKDHIGWE